MQIVLVGMKDLPPIKTRYQLTPEEVLAIRTNPPYHLNTLESAAYVNLCARKFREEYYQGRIRAAKIGSRLIFRRVDLDKYIEEAVS